MNFTKMHGLGNDYLYMYLDETPENIEELSIKYSERHFGAGADGIILILPSEVADFRMRIFNADGSEAMMCGNGIRCVGKYVYDRGYTDKETITVETQSGIKTLNFTIEDGRVALVQVDMGQAVVSEQIDVRTTCGYFFDEVTRQFSPSRRPYEMVPFIPVNVGNPHAVVFMEDVESAPIEIIGPSIEKSAEFPGGVNVEFAEVLSNNEIRMRVWERGSGVTMACGTGSCATVAAAVSERLCRHNTPITVHLDGGDLIISIDLDGQIKMTGSATFVYDGTTID